MDGLTSEELDELEKTNPDGVSSAEIVALLDQRGFKFSEATLRKYVQLGLLPKSVRVGRKGDRGSQGLYPVSIVRQIVEIKRLLSENHTIDEIRSEYFLLRGDIEGLEQNIKRLFEGVAQALEAKKGDTATEAMKRDLRMARESAAELLERLRTLESRLAHRAELARATG